MTTMRCCAACGATGAALERRGKDGATGSGASVLLCRDVAACRQRARDTRPRTTQSPVRGR